MKRKDSRILIYIVLVLLATAGRLQGADPAGSQHQQPFTTALDHLSVLEFDEPVSQVAVGSSSFQIERQGNKVFIKPLKSGASTNLFIWTASQQSFSYELSVGEVPMNARVHTAVPKSATSPDEMEQLADHVVTRTLLGFEPIDSRDVKLGSNGIALRVEGILQSQKSLYVQYSVRNSSSAPYKMLTPVVFQVQPERSRVNIVSLKGRQIDRTSIRELGRTTETALSVPRADFGSETVASGSETRGVFAIRYSGANSPTILRIALGNNADATIVF